MFGIAKQVARSGYSLLPVVDLTHQQIRTTFILKRKWAPLLAKKGDKPKTLKARHFVYELIEDTNVRKQKDLKLILTTDVEGVGVRGDEISVRPQHGYEALLLPGLAEYATDESRKRIKSTSVDENPDLKLSSPFVKRMINVLEKMIIAVVMNKDEPWTIEPWHVRVALRKAGLHVMKDSQITLPEAKLTGPDMNLENKEFLATVLINNKDTAPVRCRIHHWSTKISDRLPHEFEYWTKPVESIFPDQSNELKALPLPKPKEDFMKDLKVKKR